MRAKTQNIKVEVHPCALQEPTPQGLEITFNGKSYHFHFYIDTCGRYVALCNNVGCQDAYGEGANWWYAVNECMHKVLQKRGDKAPKRSLKQSDVWQRQKEEKT